jgi:hypothetical protein
MSEMYYQTAEKRIANIAEKGLRMLKPSVPNDRPRDESNDSVAERRVIGVVLPVLRHIPTRLFETCDLDQRDSLRRSYEISNR